MAVATPSEWPRRCRCSWKSTPRAWRGQWRVRGTIGVVCSVRRAPQRVALRPTRGHGCIRCEVERWGRCAVLGEF
eukprot:6346244-Pyramimonas_sp.AAC.1